MKILIPVDGSAHAQRALDYAIKLAGLMQAPPTLHLLNVQWNVAGGKVNLFIDPATIHDYYREEGELATQSARAALDAANISYQYHVSIGTPAQAIVQYIKEHQIDLVVMGKQGQNGLQSLLLGSVGSKVAQLADIPVTLVP